MPLELRIEKRGQERCVRPFWYGRFEVKSVQIHTAQNALAEAQESLRLAGERQNFGVGVVLENIRSEQKIIRLCFFLKESSFCLVYLISWSHS